MSNFQHVPVDLSCKLFDSLIRPIILHNSEIWFMEEYFSVFKAKNRARIHGTSCDILSLIDRFSTTGTCWKFDMYFLREKRVFSPFFESSCVDLFNLPFLSIVLPRKVYS
jgi:hypothetical protein